MRIKWQPIFTARTPTLFQWYIFEGEKEKYFKRVLGLDVAYTNGKNVLDEVFYDGNELTVMEKRLSREIQSDTTFIDGYIQTCYQKCHDLVKISHKLWKIKNYEKLKPKDLLTLYDKYQEATFDIMPFMTTPMVIDNILRKKILEVFEKERGKLDNNKQDLLLSKLVIPKKKNYFVKEQGSLLRIGLKLQNDGEADIQQDINKHVEGYAWTTTNVYLGTPQTSKDVMRKLKMLLKKNPRKELTKKKKAKEEALKEFNDIVGSIKEPAKLLRLIDLAREFLFLQTHKMEVLFLAHYYASPLFEEIGRRFGSNKDELIYLTGREIYGLLDGTYHLDKKEINNRKLTVAVIREHNKIRVLSGDKVKGVASKSTQATMVTGTIASKGKVQGKARLLFEEKDMPKIQKGDIIISPMTRPHFVPALRKASGIVTNFGGILCHAALISREFGIPCIVGTKDATKVFKDGDLIELDAYEGIVRKL